MADRQTKPPNWNASHSLFPLAVMVVGVLVVLGSVSALEWFVQKPFAGDGSSLGLTMIVVIMYVFLFRHRLESGRQLLSWCIAAVPIAAIATIIQALVLITLPTWSGGDDASPRFLSLVSGVSAIIVGVPLLILAGRIIGLPEWKRRGTEGDAGVEDT